MIKENFVKYLEDSIRENWTYNALSDYQGETFKYEEIAVYVTRIHQLFDKAGIKAGDKIAMLGRNSARWGMLYISIVSYGAVVVPLMPDFKSDDLHKIIDHSDAVMLFADNSLYEKLDMGETKKIMSVVSIDDFSVLKCDDESIKDHCTGLNDEVKPGTLDPKKFKLPEITNNQLAVISYTSGTTGFAKGVMLQHNSLAVNIRYARNNMVLKPGETVLSFLPLAHTFGCAFEFLFPFTKGCHVTILTKVPSAQIIMKAFKEIKPSLILSVPLVIEKIYKKQLLPVIGKWYMKVLLGIPGLNNVLLKKINAKLSEVFGGNFRELVIGAAPFNTDAEKFFQKMKFRFTVGYGMTECGPLISYVGYKDFVRGCSGKVVDSLSMKIDSTDPANVPGEILVKGENVMLGYYKNEEATREVLTKDGWLHTGDLGLLDENNYVFVRGRLKNMILGPSGKNIYPEEIESAFNTKEGVGETVVVQRDGKLVALINTDQEYLRLHKISGDDVKKLLDHHRKSVNNKLPKYMSVSQVEIHAEEFVKTPKKNIKRFLYK